MTPLPRPAGTGEGGGRPFLPEGGGGGEGCGQEWQFPRGLKKLVGNPFGDKVK